MTTTLITSNSKKLALTLTAVGTSLAAGGAQAGIVIGSGALATKNEADKLFVGQVDSGLSVATSSNPGESPKLVIHSDGSAAVTQNALGLGDVVGPGAAFTLDPKSIGATPGSSFVYGLRSDGGQYGWVSLYDISYSEPTPDGFLQAKYDYAFQTGTGCTIAAGVTTETCAATPSSNSVPEPSGLALLAAGLVAASVARRRAR